MTVPCRAAHNLMFVTCTITLGLLIWRLGYLFELIRSEVPHEVREGAQLVISDYFQRGELYQIECLPRCLNVYGPVYPIVASMPVAFLGNSMLTHRAISTFAILLCAILLAFRLAAEGVPKQITFIASVVVLDRLGSGWTATARPDALGFLLFMSAIFIGCKEEARGSTATLWASVTLGAIAGLTKPYFILALPIVATWLLYERRRRELTMFAFISILIGMLSCAILNIYFPLYWISVLSIHHSAQSLSFAYMVNQFGAFSIQMFPAILLILFSYFSFKFAVKSSLSASRFASLSSIALAFGLLTCLWLGQHRGAYMLYFDHLVFPWIVTLAGLSAHSERLRSSVAISLLTILAISFSSSIPVHSNDNWQFLQARVASSTNPYLGALAVALDSNHKAAYFNSGQSEYASLAVREVSRYQEDLSRRLNADNNRVVEQVSKGAFDLMILNSEMDRPVSREVLMEHYELKWQGALPMLFSSSPLNRLEIWEPLHASKKAPI